MRWNTMLAAALLAAAVLPASAQDKEALYVRSLAATCANCHGTDGRAQAGSSVVSLAGMPREQIVAQMKAFQSGARSATIMHQLSKGYSDAQIAQIAGYFASKSR